MFRSSQTRAGRGLWRTSLAGVLGLAVSAALPVSTAEATEPTRQTIIQLAVRFTAPPCASGIVPLGLFDVTRDITTYYDPEGVPVRRLSSNRAEGIYWNPVTGATLTGTVVREVHTDLRTGEWFSTGAYALFRLPGGGGVSIPYAGLSVFDAAGHLVKDVGPDLQTEQAQFCAALGA